MRTLLPGYPAVTAQMQGGRIVAEFADLFGGPGRLIAGRAGGLDVIVLAATHLYERPGNPYLAPEGWDWPDNWRRFAALGWAAGQLAVGIVPGYQPQVVHAHDWQAALAPAYVKYGPLDTVKSVLTVHNLAFQGHFGSDVFPQLRLPPHAYWEGLEYFGGVGFLKAGLYAADAITTVSPTYAQEIRTPAYGMGLEGLLQARSADLHGILNGVDTDAWDPATDPHLPQQFSASRLHLRRINKAALGERFGLEPGDGPIFGVVSRLTWQKGMDMLVACVDRLVAAGGRLVVLGSGDAEIENGLRGAVQRHPGRVGMVTGYDEALSHLIQGGSDALLVPSRFEPCGLTQMYALRYGAVPVVARVGGLADTVIDANEAAIRAEVATGVQFLPATEQGLDEAIRRTVALYQDRSVWQRMQRRGMKSDVSWLSSAERYADLYANLLELKRDEQPDA